MQTFSAFDIIGPRMIGPSSSHTAGAANAPVSADLALCGGKSLLPFDETAPLPPAR